MFKYNHSESLPKFVHKLKTEYLSLGMMLKNCANITQIYSHKVFDYFPTDAITFYSKTEESFTIKIIKEINIDIPEAESIDEVFFDWRAYNINVDITKNILQAIKILINKKFAGYYIKDWNTFLLTDWTHSDKLIPVAMKALKELINLLPFETTLIKQDPIITSQKLKGIKLLAEHYYSLPTIIINDETMIPNKLPASFTHDLVFIRTCPKKPRHGILENYIVPSNTTTIKLAVQKLKMEMFDKGEYPQMAIQPFIYNALNIVYNNGVLVFGIGNDGVTNQSDWSITLTKYKLKIEDDLKDKSKLKTFDLEIIYDYLKNKLYLVQIREAEAAKQIKTIKYKNCFEGFLPTNPISIKDKEIIFIENLSNLDELEKINNPRHIICAHMKGNILSHAAAWCRQKNIPYIIIDNPKQLKTFKYIYEIKPGVLKLTQERLLIDKIQIEKEDYSQDFIEGYYYGLDNFEYSKLFGWETYLYFQLFASGFVNTKPCAILAGIFVGFMMNTILMLAYGELRHAVGQIKIDNLYPFIRKFLTAIPFPPNLSRNYVYQLFCDLQLTLDNKKQLATLLDQAFNKLTWQSSSYGGTKWGTPFCNGLLRKLLETKDAKKLILTTNNLLNLAHNGGWYFNKFIDKEFLDLVYKNTLTLSELHHFAKGFKYLKDFYIKKQKEAL